MYRYTESKNCKNQIKGIYEVDFTLTKHFMQALKQFGELKVLDFSQFSPSAKVFFKVSYEDVYCIEGTLNENLLFFSCKKTHLHFKEQWEHFLTTFKTEK